MARRTALRLLALSALTAPWNAVVIKGVELGDLLLLAAALTLLVHLASARQHGGLLGLPGAVWLGSALIGAAGIWTALSPAGASYMNDRVQEVSPYVLYGVGRGVGGNLSQLVKFEVALVVLPLIVMLLRPSRDEIRRLADMLVLSAVVSCLVACSDRFAHTGISRKLLGFVDITGRASGLTQQPNHLAIAIVLALPIAIAWFARPRLRLAAGAVSVLFFVGLLLTGSRGGLAAGALTIPATIAVMRMARSTIIVLATAASVPLLIVAPALIRLLSKNRTGGGAQASDQTRASLRHQGYVDFLHSPFHGIGYSVVDQAHEVHLQLLAAGGLLALVGFAVYMVSVMRRAHRASHVDPVCGNALLISLYAWLMLMFVENQLTNRYLYIPVALVLALAGGSDATAELGPSEPPGARRGDPAPGRAVGKRPAYGPSPEGRRAIRL